MSCSAFKILVAGSHSADWRVLGCVRGRMQLRWLQRLSELIFTFVFILRTQVRESRHHILPHQTFFHRREHQTFFHRRERDGLLKTSTAFATIGHD
jgi:hypothetical protein